MKPQLVDMAYFVMGLLEHPESLIKIGRHNQMLEDTDENYIVVDELSSVNLGSSKEYDGDNEVMAYSGRSLGRVTLNFYGDEAYSNASRFRLLKQSQRSYELQKSIGIAVFQPSQITDLRFIGGTQQSNRFEVEVTVQYTESVSVDTLSIETAQFEFLNDK